MKKNIRTFCFHLAFVFVFLSIVPACKDDEPTTPGNEEEEGEVRPVGETIGNLFTKEIGAQGGTISVDEGSITLKIPAGALDENVSIGVQEIETTNLAGIGKSYRLTPHDVEFKEPIEISFSYDETVVASVQTLGIAFQDEKNVWNYVANPVIDTETKTVTVKSDHFSDWGIMAYTYLIPMDPTIETGGRIELTAVRFVRIDDDLLAPLIPNHKYTPIREPVDLESKFIGEWKLAGEGDLKASGNKAIYSAPAFTPDNNPVAVSLQLKTSKMQVLLISNIMILGGAVEFRINGGSLIELEANAVQLAPGYYGVSSNSSDPKDGVLTFFWTGGVGTHPYTRAGDYNTHWGYVGPQDSGEYYGHTYEDEETQESHISPGGITITSMGDAYGYVEGTFILTKSGHVNLSSGQIGTTSIEGKFRVMKAF